MNYTTISIILTILATVLTLILTAYVGYNTQNTILYADVGIKVIVILSLLGLFFTR